MQRSLSMFLAAVLFLRLQLGETIGLPPWYRLQRRSGGTRPPRSSSKSSQVTHITGPGDKTHGSLGCENPILDTYNEPYSARAGEGNSNEPKQRSYPSGGHQAIHATLDFLGSYQGL